MVLPSVTLLRSFLGKLQQQRHTQRLAGADDQERWMMCTDSSPAAPLAFAEVPS
jgi:hypothetical protein